MADEPESRFVIETWQTEGGWSAASDFWRVEAEGGATEEDAVNEVAGSVLCALGQLRRPPRLLRLVVQRRREGGAGR
jgi:hypothetical protein